MARSRRKDVMPGDVRRRFRSTPRRIGAAAAVIGVCAVFPVFVNTAVGYVPLLMAVLLIGVSAAYLGYTARFVECELESPYREYLRGEQGDLSVVVRNGSPFLLFRVEPEFCISGLEGEGGDTVRTRSVLNAREGHAFSIDVMFEHVGIYQAGVRRVEVFDLLGLFSCELEMDELCRIRVVPRIWPIEGIRMSEMTTTEALRSQKSVLSDDMDYAYVRDYELGDPMKTVHWKLSARTPSEHLFTKLFESHTNPGLTVVCDLYSTEKEAERKLALFDTMLEVAFSIINYAREAQIESTLVFYGRDGSPVRTAENELEKLDEMIDDIPRLSEDGGPKRCAHLLRTLAEDPDVQLNFVLVSTCLEDETVGELGRLRSLHRGVRVIYVVPASMESGERGRRLGPLRSLSEAGVTAGAIDSAEDVWKVIG